MAEETINPPRALPEDLPRGPLTEIFGFCANELRELGIDDSGAIEPAGQRQAFAKVMRKIRELHHRGER